MIGVVDHQSSFIKPTASSELKAAQPPKESQISVAYFFLAVTSLLILVYLLLKVSKVTGLSKRAVVAKRTIVVKSNRDILAEDEEQLVDDG
jgi:hypothetical protein